MGDVDLSLRFLALIRGDDCLYLTRQCRDDILRNIPDDIVIDSHIIVDEDLYIFDFFENSLTNIWT